jgi:hypothetical protein
MIPTSCISRSLKAEEEIYFRCAVGEIHRGSECFPQTDKEKSLLETAALSCTAGSYKRKMSDELLRPHKRIPRYACLRIRNTSYRQCGRSGRILPPTNIYRSMGGAEIWGSRPEASRGGGVEQDSSCIAIYRCCKYAGIANLRLFLIYASLPNTVFGRGLTLVLTDCRLTALYFLRHQEPHVGRCTRNKSVDWYPFSI